ncbi:hypothetical protein SAMN00017405_0994 [Desulfonispora thiosulfatigenes DSM 11270]|uniref:Signal transducing protein n=1 Tax=Desulfonispora thiosulfatigenes DSM 11270 TaxID=656914 RepID=A0A1W1UPH3_DESTI|nr:glutamate decarboxylase [Desulfonispora thiosulfatigenes]SMB83038.1 hypothetical protein SAMN00017405_0994 [Desulfonispora thiosulfatigenes DSM 11270]
MWTIIYIAPNRIIAEQISTLLKGEGLLVNLKSMGVPHLGDSGAVEISVPESEAEEAIEIINSSISF